MKALFRGSIFFALVMTLVFPFSLWAADEFFSRSNESGFVPDRVDLCLQNSPAQPENSSLIATDPEMISPFFASEEEPLVESWQSTFTDPTDLSIPTPSRKTHSILSRLADHVSYQEFYEAYALAYKITDHYAIGVSSTNSLTLTATWPLARNLELNAYYIHGPSSTAAPSRYPNRPVPENDLQNERSVGLGIGWKF